MADAVVKRKKSALKGKGGLVMAGLLAVLGIWLFFDFKKPVRDPDSPPPVSEFVGMTSSDVRRVEVKQPKGGVILANSDSKWVFEAPKPSRAQSQNVDSWLKTLLEEATITQE